MNAIAQLRNAEARMVQAIDQATAAVDEIGTTAATAALARLDIAVQRAQERLAGVLFDLAARIGQLTETTDAIAAEITRDTADVPTEAPVAAQDAPEPVPVPEAPPAPQNAPESQPEPVDGDSLAPPVNRVAELMGAPAPNGTHKAAPRKGGAKRKK